MRTSYNQSVLRGASQYLHVNPTSNAITYRTFGRDNPDGIERLQTEVDAYLNATWNANKESISSDSEPPQNESVQQGRQIIFETDQGKKGG